MMAVKTEYRGASITEAVNNACENLAVSRDDLDIEVVSAGSAGILGFFKRPVIITAVSGGTAAKPTGHNSKGGPKNGPVAAPPANAVSEISHALKKILGLLDIEAEVKVKLDDHNHIKAHISSSDEQAVIGREGENIDAIQYLLRKIISHNYPSKIFFSLDVGNYRETRKKHLESLALSVANKARKTGKSQIIGALNPAERRIVHVTLQDDKAIRSVSVGGGLFKKIKIYTLGKARNDRSPKYQNKEPV
ncbi:MAG: KH domain-containing protein [Deltaproteobacteria bacterium]|nr:KH domain-containing protein [Deltaproteobacteria bacterium]